MSYKRDTSIDFLRAVGLLMIILAHVTAPKIIHQLRNFDVVLMVLIIGYVYMMNTKKGISYSSYIIKRFKRLIIPTWSFLIFYFILFSMLPQWLNIRYETRDYIYSFLLLSGQPDLPGIGFVWIMRIYFSIAFVLPISASLLNKYGMSRFCLGLSFLWGVYELLIILSVRTSFLGSYFEWYVIYSIGYGIISSIGFIIYRISKRNLIALSITFFCIFCALMPLYGFEPTQKAKYPPSIYYVSYALFVCFCGFYFAKKYENTKVINNRFISFLSNNSLWIYLWHIIPVNIINNSNFTLLNESFIVRYICVLLIALIITKIHNFINSLMNSTLLWKKKY